MSDSLNKAQETKKRIKLEWKDLWANKIEDKEKAEGISVKDYTLLDVDRGQVLHAPRDCPPLSLHELIEKQMGKEIAERVDVDPNVGGWRKFAKKNFPANKKTENNRRRPILIHDLTQHQRKGGAGWLNKFRIIKKKKENNRIQ
jgi:hypothetical protein